VPLNESKKDDAGATVGNATANSTTPPLDVSQIKLRLSVFKA
jgi:hypothetical protein